MTTDFDSLTLEEKAKQLVHAWFHSNTQCRLTFQQFAESYLKDFFDNKWPEALKTQLLNVWGEILSERLIKELDSGVPQESSKAFASLALKAWINNGDIFLPEPSPVLQDAIERAYANLKRRPSYFANELWKIGAQALALSEEKVPITHIAKELSITQSAARRLIVDSKRQVTDLISILAGYGYECIKKVKDD